MITDDIFHTVDASQNGATSPLQMVRVPDWRWILRWVVLTAVAIPAALLLTAPFAAILMPIFNLGVDAGIITSYDPNILYSTGFLIGFSLSLATMQWLLLRNYLPNARDWFLATGMGVMIGGTFIGLGFSILSDLELEAGFEMTVYLLSVGCAVGMAQWLILRRILPNTFWIVIIDIAAACSLLFIIRPITNLPEMLASLIVLAFPGWISGLGIWLLIRKSQRKEGIVNLESPAVIRKRSFPAFWIGLALVALIPMFFLCSWVYAVSQLALAKNEGIYATVEDAVIIKNSQGWGGAEVIKLEDVRASVNQHDGSKPHVWFGGARVYLDRVPQGWDRTTYLSGSYYLHVKEGWVHVPEGAFPEFIGWVMQLYGMEGVNEWIAEKR